MKTLSRLAWLALALSVALFANAEDKPVTKEEARPVAEEKPATKPDTIVSRQRAQPNIASKPVTPLLGDGSTFEKTEEE